MRQNCSSVTNALPSSASRSRDVPIRPLRLSSRSLPQAGTWERHIALSMPQNDYGTVIRNVASDPLCKISSSVQSDFRPIGNVFKYTLNRRPLMIHLLALAHAETLSTAQANSNIGASHDGTQSMSPVASILNALGSPPLKLCVQTRRGAPGSQSSNVVTIQSGSAPEAFRLPSNYFAARSSTSDLPVLDSRDTPLADWDPSHSSNTVQHLPIQAFGIPRAPLVREDAKTQTVKRTTKSMPQLSPPRLLPGLLDPATIDSDGTALTNNDSPCAPGKLRKGGRPNHYRGFSRPRDIPRLDYDLPGDFGESVRSKAATVFTNPRLILAVPGFGRVAPERRTIDLDDFAFVIPLNCATSTPVAARKRALKKGLLSSGSGAGAAALGVGPSPRRITSPRKRILPGPTSPINNSPRHGLAPKSRRPH
jgi:hypothetical protein